MSSTSLGAKLESAMNTDVALESYSVTEDEMIRLNQQYMLYVLDFGQMLRSAAAVAQHRTKHH
jgi:hypothetical protein